MKSENGKRIAVIFEILLIAFLGLHTSWAGAYLFEGPPPASADFFVYHAWLLPGLLMAGFVDLLLLWAINRAAAGGHWSHYGVIGVAGLISAAMQITYMAVHRPVVEVSSALPGAELVQWVVDATMIGLPIGVVILMLALAAAASTRIPSERREPVAEIRERTLTVYEPPAHGYGTWSERPSMPVQIRQETGLGAPQLAAVPPERTFSHIAQNTPRSGQRNGGTEGRVQMLDDGQWVAVCECGRQFAKATEAGARNALSRHMGHCQTVKMAKASIEDGRA